MDNAMKTREDVEEELKHFREFLAPTLASKIEIKDEPVAERKGENTSEAKYYRPWLPSKFCGVYLLLNDKAQLLCVGLARVNFDKRVWTHKEISWRYLDVISFKRDDERRCLAAALEEFLIDKLNPPHNKNMKR